MPLDTSQALMFGSCNVTYDGTNIGHVDDKGAKVSLKSEFVRAYAGKYGKKTPVKIWLAGQDVEIELTLIQTALTDLEKLIPGATRVTGSGKTKLTFGSIAGKALTPLALVLKPVGSGMTPAYDFTMAAAVPVGDAELVYSGDAYNVWKIKFQGVINEAGGADGSYLFSFGDATASADVTPPTANVVPTDADTGIALASTVVWTCSESLDGNTVNTATVKVIKDPLGTAAEVAGTVVLSNAGAATTVTFTPTSLLAATTDYAAYLTNGVKDLAGNAFVSMITSFTTLTP